MINRAKLIDRANRYVEHLITKRHLTTREYMIIMGHISALDAWDDRERRLADDRRTADSLANLCAAVAGMGGDKNVM